MRAREIEHESHSLVAVSGRIDVHPGRAVSMAETDPD